MPRVTAWKRTLASWVERTRMPVHVGRWLGFMVSWRWRRGEREEEEVEEKRKEEGGFGT